MEVELTSGTLADLCPTVTPKRGLVLVPDAAGRRPLLAELAEGLATAHNWNVIVVDLFRGGLGPRSNPQDGQPHDWAIQQLDDDEVVGDLVEAANRLEADPVAVLGIGLGGMYAFKASASHRFDRVVSMYGLIEVPHQWKGPGQREPLALLGHAEDTSDIWACYGTSDQIISEDQILALESTGVNVVRYPDREHGFVHDPSDAVHSVVDAADVWARVVKHLAV